jgi:hypothetical protein
MAKKPVKANLVVSALITSFAVTCGCTSPTAPENPPVLPDGPFTSISGLRIAGLPPTVASGASAQLTGEVVLQTGVVKECSAATWSVDDAKVASVSSSGLLTGRESGYVNVTFSCEGLVATAETKVEGANPYRLVIYAQDSEVRTLLNARLEFLDGPRTGERITSSDVLENGLQGVTWPVRVRLTADGYEPKDVVLSESTGRRFNDHLFEFRVPMRFAPDPLTDTYARQMSETESATAHPFTMRAPGPVQVRTWWAVDYNDRLTVELWCSGRLLRSITQGGARGDGFTHDVPAPGACEVRLRQHKTDADTEYRLAIRYAR